jgi:hypothetical protein
MANEDSIRFTLSDNTDVVVKKVTNNKYDFELTLPNGNRKTFIWLGDGMYDFSNRRGSKDGIAEEAINRFIELSKAL